MDISRLSKQDLEIMLFDNTLAPDLKQKIAKRVVQLGHQEELNENTVKKEHIEILKSMNKKMETIDGVLDMLSEQFSSTVNINQEQIKEIHLLISEMKTIIESTNNNEKEGKLKKVLKRGIDMGSQVALPLLVEYIKIEATKGGIL